MAKYNDDLKQLNLPEIDRIIRQFWEENDIFNKSVQQKSVDNSFVFYEGPPSANGKPGIHHVMGRAVKDLFCRYQTMKGKRPHRAGPAWRQPGCGRSAHRIHRLMGLQGREYESRGCMPLRATTQSAVLLCTSFLHTAANCC